MDLLNKILSKKVLFLDLKTTGFPEINQNPKIYNSLSGEYFDYNMNKKYDRSRILQINWFYNDNFTLDFVIDNNLIESMMRKPFNFDFISDDALIAHKITIEHATKHGTLIKKTPSNHFRS